MIKERHGHRWTTKELQKLIGMWLREMEVKDICKHFQIAPTGLNKLIQRLRKNGVPLPLRKKGHKPDRYNKPWTQEEVETVVRMRNAGSSTSDIADALERSFYGAQGMILRLKNEDIPIKSFGSGMRKLWDPQRLREACSVRNLVVIDGDKKAA